MLLCYYHTSNYRIAVSSLSSVVLDPVKLTQLNLVHFRALFVSMQVMNIDPESWILNTHTFAFSMSAIS